MKIQKKFPYCFSPKVIKKFYRKFLLSKIKIENEGLFSKTVDVKKIK